MKSNRFEYHRESKEEIGVEEKVVKGLSSILGGNWVSTEIDRIGDYLIDETPEPVRPEPDIGSILAKPGNAEEVSQVLKYANRDCIPVIPRGGGTGLCAAVVAPEPSIILSLERLNRILEVDKDNLMVTCEAGATLEELIAYLDTEVETLSFPIHPGSEAAQVGGMIATNAGGVRAVRHGVMRNYVRGLEVVLPTGEITTMGGKLLKNNTGYDLMQLMIGSEGTLGIITKAVLRLYPRANMTITLLVSYEHRHAAVNSVPKILQKGILPLAIEYVEKREIVRSAEHLGKEWPAKKGNAYLVFIVQGASEDELYAESEEIESICKAHNSIETLVAQGRKEQDNILRIRSNTYMALKRDLADILDMAVPPASIGALMDRVDKIAQEYQAYIPMYGHVADGNLHPHLMKVNGELPPHFEQIKERIYREAIELGGVVTAEHGVGRTRIKNLPLTLSVREMELMQGIKKVFDPNNILSPGVALAGESERRQHSAGS
jgi:glycolate oxidase